MNLLVISLFLNISSLFYYNLTDMWNRNSVEIGFLTKQKVIQLRNDGYDRKLNCFFLGVLSSFKVAVSYAKKNFPFNDPLLQNSSFLNFGMRKTSKFSQVEYFINRFPLLEKYKEDENYDILNQEFYAC